MASEQARLPAVLAARLRHLDIDPELVPHAPQRGAMEVAESAGVPGAALAKTVVIRTGDEPHAFLCLVMPSTEHVHLGELREALGTMCALATEAEVDALFPDCHHDSLPPCGQLYNLRTLVDPMLILTDTVYCGTGNRAALMKLTGDEFRSLMEGAALGTWQH